MWYTGLFKKIEKEKNEIENERYIEVSEDFEIAFYFYFFLVYDSIEIIRRCDT